MDVPSGFLADDDAELSVKIVVSCDGPPATFGCTKGHVAALLPFCKSEEVLIAVTGSDKAGADRPACGSIVCQQCSH